LTAPRVPSHHHDDRQHRANGTDEHQNPSNFVDVEAVLVGLCDCPVKNGPNSNAITLTTSPPAPIMRTPFNLLQWLYP
jgi:hypothetical protein